MDEASGRRRDTSSDTEELDLINFPLHPCRLIKLKQYYYAIGNSPARNIFYRDISQHFDKVKLMQANSWRYQTFDQDFETALEKSSNQVQDLRVLCLACGDLRNVLFSLGSTTGIGEVSIVVNDYDIHVLARNILLLDMMFTMQPTTDMNETIFAVWFSTALLDHQLEALRHALRKLLGQSVRDGGSAWMWECAEPGLLDELRDVWGKWLGFFSLPGEGARTHWKRTQEMRHIAFLENVTSLTPEDARKLEGSTAKARLQSFNRRYRSTSLVLHTLNVDRKRQVNARAFTSWEQELQDHLLTGIFFARTGGTLDEECCHVNPTLFKTQETYDLHYGTNSFSAFPLLLPSAGVSWVDSCFGIFSDWIERTRRHRQKLKWTFSGLDCQTFCLNFDSSSTTLLNNPRSDTPIQGRESLQLLSRGTIVFTHGLQKNPSLNGAVGIVTCRASDKGRWGVRLIKLSSSTRIRDVPEKCFSFKESNLLVVKLEIGMSKTWDSHGSFDVITTSNVADHIGLSTLLLISRPLLVAGGTLMTTTFLHATSHNSTKEFLESSLLESDRSWWPVLFGFRPMGYESAHSTSPACKTAFCEYEANFAVSQKDSTIVWLATNSGSNLPLAKDGPIARHLLRYKKDASSYLEESLNLHSKAIVLLHKHGCTYSLAASDKDSTEVAFLTEVLRPSHCSDVTLFSFDVEDETIRRVFCSGFLASPTPVMFIMVKATVIHGLWLGRTSATTTPTTRFFFWCSRKCVEEAGGRISLYSDNGGLVRCLERIGVMQCEASKERVQRLVSVLTGRQEFQEAGPRSIGAIASFHIFNDSDTHVSLLVKPNTSIFDEKEFSTMNLYLEQIDQFRLSVKLDLPGIKNAKGIVVGDLCFPFPIELAGWKFDRKSELLKIGKGKYSFFSAARICMIPGCTYRDLRGSETVCWTKSALITFSGIQMTSSERVHRGRKDNDASASYKMPMLTEVKDSIMLFLQVDERLVYIVIKEGNIGCVAMIIRHGILMDSLKGHPVLDLSVCFLSSATSLLMANAVHHLNSPEGRRDVHMWNEQYQLFQNLCNFTRATMAPELRTEHPSLRSLIDSKMARANFRRILLKPLFPSAGDVEDVLQEVTGRSFETKIH